MKNSIDAHLEFSFKGQTHALSTTVDLDRLVLRGASFDTIHQMLATAGNIDTYSYAYEVMLEEEMRFDRACGLASEFLRDGVFDLDGFEQCWREQRIAIELQEIANRIMGIADLEQHPQLRDALREAYRSGTRA